MKNADLPAMPTNYVDIATNGQRETYRDQVGLTKREQFAAMAMQGLLSGNNADCDLYETSADWVKNLTEASVEFSDALLAELERTK